MSRKRLISLATMALLLCFSLLLTSCAAERIELAPEEAHELCETYEKETEWIKSGTNSVMVTDLKYGVAGLEQSGGASLCKFKITDAKLGKVQLGVGAPYPFTFELTVTVEKSYLGDLQKGQKLTVFGGIKSGDASYLIGKEYVSFVQFSQPVTQLWNYWTFLVCEDGTLVSPFGCPVEEEEQAQGRSLDCRNYTGQKLDYFVGVVKDLIKEVRSESDSAQ